MAERRYRCTLCRPPEQPWGLEFSAHEPQCPRCKASGDMAILPLVNVHLYVLDLEHGPIPGMHGRRFRVACSPGKTNPGGVPCTTEPGAVTCPRCKATREYQAAQDLAGELLGAVLLEE